MSIHWGGRGAGHISRWSTAVSSAALTLNFLSGVLDPRITFSRATTATFVGSDGLIQSAAINAPRFDYDPVTLAPKGLLVEEARTNLLINSPISGVSIPTQSVTVTAVPHTISFYGTGTVTLSGVAAASVVGTGAYPNRRTLTFTPTAGVLICTVVGLVQYAQLEAGSFATSFIPTAGTAIARSADVGSMTGTNFSSWYNQSEGTFVAGVTYLNVLNTAWTYTAHSGTAASTNSYIAAVKNSGAIIRHTVVAAGVSQGNIDLVTAIAGTIYKMAGAYKANDVAFSVNGATPGVDTTVTLPTPNALAIGNLFNQYLNGHIRQIAYYNTRLPNAQLQALTA